MKFLLADYEIDTVLFSISRGGTPLAVEPRVFDLIVYLITHRDRVVSRDELFREVWQGREVSDTSLSNHIKSARKLLGDDGERQVVIRTLRGRGYQFIAPLHDLASPLTGKAESAGGAGSNAATDSAAGPQPPAAPGSAGITPHSPRGFRLAAGGLVVVLLLAVLLLWPAAESEMTGAAEPDTPYILVVPFDVSADDPDSWRPFADQVTREVIRNLRKISGLQVVPPPSAFTFSEDKTRDYIRRQLPAVRYVLDGIVSLGANNSVRITAELEDLQNNTLVWDEDYQSRIDDTNFFSVQAGIAASVSESLQVAVEAEERRSLARLPTSDLKAYELYVAGRQQMELFNQPALERAIALFERAVAEDPRFTSAYIAKADANRMLMTYFEEPVEMLPSVVESVSQALRLEPDSAEALSSLGLAYVLAWRWEDAWNMLSAARERDPSLALTELGFALYYAGLGDVEGVRRSVTRADSLDPLNIELADWGQWVQSMVGEVDAALAWSNAKLKLHPGVGVVHGGAGVTAALAGDYPRAIEQGELGAELDARSPISLITLAQIYGFAGQVGKIQPLLDEAAAYGAYMCPYETAVAKLLQGEIDAVFALLDQAVELRSNCLVFTRNDPRLEPIRDDPRYQVLLTRIGLDDTALAGYPR